MIKTKEIRYLDKEEADSIILKAAAIELFSQRQIASHLGISVSYLNKILKGKKPISKELQNQFLMLGIEL